MNTRIVEIIIGVMLIGLVAILVVVVMKNKEMEGRQGTERLSAEQVVGLEVQAAAEYEKQNDASQQ